MHLARPSGKKFRKTQNYHRCSTSFIEFRAAADRTKHASTSSQRKSHFIWKKCQKLHKKPLFIKTSNPWGRGHPDSVPNRTVEGRKSIGSMAPGAALGFLLHCTTLQMTDINDAKRRSCRQATTNRRRRASPDCTDDLFNSVDTGISNFSGPKEDSYNTIHFYNL